MKRWFATVADYIRRHKKTDYIALGVSLTTFAAITLVNAPRASIWFDEAFSAYIAQFSFWDIARFTAGDVHPPFYYWLLKIWSDLFGTTELAYRSLSILFGLAAIVVAFFLMRKLFGRRVAGVSLLFLTVSPMLVRYSDEARMYTLSTLIVLGATYLLVKAMETKQRKYWLLYGVLVSLGMWTHYFTALAWLAHWVWWIALHKRPGNGPVATVRVALTKEWVQAYVFAVILFIPWLVFMVRQLVIVQAGGFWIGPVGVDTINNYFANVFYYLEHDQVKSWLALAMFVVLLAAALIAPKAYKALKAGEKRHYLLITSLAILSPLLLFLVSLPLPRSSFVERYLVPAAVAFSLFLAVTFVVGTRRWKMLWRVALVSLVVAMMVFGVTNVYKYGNFNKNSNTHILTRQVIESARAVSEPGVPIVANDPWIFYEAVAYETDEHKVYFVDESTEYKYGSLDMLKDTDLHKIKNLAEFEKNNKVFWYLANTNQAEVPAYKSSWKALKTVSITDSLTGQSQYKATLYTTVNAE